MDNPLRFHMRLLASVLAFGTVLSLSILLVLATIAVRTCIPWQSCCGTG